MKNFVCYVSLAFFWHAAAGQSGAYTLASVPEAVKTKATVVTHFENIELEIESIDKATLKVDRLFTVTSEEGKAALLFSQYSSKDISIEDAEIRVFDANGKQTERYRQKDMRTVATGEGLIEDGYVTYYYVSTPVYPITIEHKYEIRIKGTLNIPPYRIIAAREGVVESNFTARVPADIGLRYKAKHTNIEPVVTDEGKYKVYKWSVKNLAPLEYEEGATGSIDQYPHIMLASDRFSSYGMEGSLASWKSFGAWLGNLYNGLDVLPPDRRQFFMQLVKDAPDEKEKIKRIYSYLQHNFRYVSIQLGIGGYRPFPADFTDKKKYGDCKALSNYMKAALKAVGIKSYVAIINAEYNEEPVDPDFPSNNFNHVILCVPGQKDSVWLECTSSTTGFNELGTFTENRYALLLTEEGGGLAPTPKSISSANKLSSSTTVSLDEDLSGQSETVFTTTGEYSGNMSDLLKQKTDEQKKVIVAYLGARQPDAFELSGIQARDEYRTSLKMAIAKIPEFASGNKLFIAPRVYKAWSSVLPKAENRKLDFYFPYPFEKTDTTIFKLPASIKPDALPKDNESSCAYALYRTKYWYNEANNAIYSTYTLILRQHKIPAADYAAVKKFFDGILQDGTQKIVIKRGEPEKKAF